jgi:putative endonuclease
VENLLLGGAAVPYYVYIIKCCDATYYTGYTVDIDRRLEQYQQGCASKYTRGRTPVELVYLESHLTKSEALKREIHIKKLPRAKKQLLIESEGGNIEGITGE